MYPCLIKQEACNNIFLFSSVNQDNKNIHIELERLGFKTKQILLTVCSSSFDAASPNNNVAPPNITAVATAKAFPTTKKPNVAIRKLYSKFHYLEDTGRAMIFPI